MLQAHLLTVISSQFGYSAHDGGDVASLELVKDLDALGLIDWLTPDAHGAPLLHALLEKRMRVDVLEYALSKHGPDLMELKDGAGRNLIDHVLAQPIPKYGETPIPVMVTLLQHARQPFLQSWDAPGAPVGAGLFQRMLPLDEARLFEALAARGMGATANKDRLANVLPRMTTTALSALLSEGMSLQDSVPTAPGVMRPLWAHALSRNINLSSLAQVHWPEQSDPIWAWKNLYFCRSKASSKSPALPVVLEVLNELPSQAHAQDDLGRLAAWVAALKNPLVLRDLQGAVPHLATHRDEQGHGIWFHLYPLLANGSLDGVKWSGSRTLEALGDPADDQVNGRGLMAQWFEDPQGLFMGLAFPFPSHIASVSDKIHPGLRLAAKARIWDMPPEAAQRVGENWLKLPYALASRVARAYQEYASDDIKKPGPWAALAEHHPAWPFLRGPMALLMWKAQVKKAKDNQSGGGVDFYKDQRKILDKLISLHWEPMPSFNQDDWLVQVEQAPKELQEIGRQLAHQVRVSNRLIDLASIPSGPTTARARPRA